MRPGLSTIAESSNITAQWLFEVDSNYWTFGNNTAYDSNIYTSRIISESFTGINEKNTRYADRLIPPNTTQFAITGEKTDFNPSDFVGEDVLVTLLDAGTKIYSWRFYVKSCYYEYGKFNFNCEDFLQQYLFENYFPNTRLLNSYNDTTAIMNGPENAVIPEMYGTAYPQLRMIPDSGEWYTVLGVTNPGAYTITEIQSPVEFGSNRSTYTTPTYTFTQSIINGLYVFENDIGFGGVNAPFGKSGKLYDMPTKLSWSGSSTVTNPADIIADILKLLGVPVSQIDTSGTFATTKTTLTTLGITYNYCFTTKEDAVKVLCELLESCNCILPRSDVVQLIALEDTTAVKTINRDNILNLQFSGKQYKENFDGGYATYYTEVQAGEPSEIAVPINGVSYTNLSAEKVLYRYTSDTQIIQKLAIINYRRKFLQTGTVSFSSNHSMLEPYLGDRLDIDDDLYEDYDNVYVDQITIKPDLKFEFSLDAYSETIGDLTDYSPTAVSKITDLSPFVAPFLLENLHVGENEAGTHVENSAILSGQTAYDTGNGWFLGRSGSYPKFSLKNASGQFLRFGNNNLECSGMTISSAEVTDSDGLTINASSDLFLLDGGAIKFTMTNSATISGNISSLKIYPDSDTVGQLNLGFTNDRWSNIYSRCYNSFDVLVGTYGVGTTSGSSLALGRTVGALMRFQVSGTGQGRIQISTTEVKISGDSTNPVNIDGTIVTQTVLSSAPADSLLPSSTVTFYYVSGQLYAKWKQGATSYTAQIS